MDKDIRLKFSFTPTGGALNTFTEFIGASLKKDKAAGSGPGTDFIFNVGTRISVDGLSSDGPGDTCYVFLEIQEI